MKFSFVCCWVFLCIVAVAGVLNRNFVLRHCTRWFARPHSLIAMGFIACSGLLLTAVVVSFVLYGRTKERSQTGVNSGVWWMLVWCAL